MSIKFFTPFLCIGLFLVLFGASFVVHAQDYSNAKAFQVSARAGEGDTLVAGQSIIRLWGVKGIEGMSAQFSVSSRNALDNVVGKGKVRCEPKRRDGTIIVAQCTSANDIDLGLYMLNQGFVISDRTVVYETAFEGPYIEAEQNAQDQGLGVWSSGQNEGVVNKDQSFMMTMGALLLLALLGAFSILAFAIMRGFLKVTASQNENMGMIVRERALRDKEREIIATMLDSEIKANKSKIEAYLAVYDEMLKDIENTEREPKYKMAGDIVQAQPSLDRAVFDRNTDKLDILGNALSSQVVHFYARIKSRPDYIDLKPEDRIEEAKDVVEKALQNASLLNGIADHLIDLFAQGGHASEDY